MFLFLAPFLRTEAFKYSTLLCLGLHLLPGQQSRSLKPMSRDYLFVSPTVLKSLFTSHVVPQGTGKGLEV